MPLPTISLMHPALAPRPIQHDAWIYEEKIDGFRMLAYKEGPAVRLISRQGKDLTRRFAELASAIQALGFHSLILDGEVARSDEQLVSRFEWLRASSKDEVATPPMFMVFDLLQLDRDDLRGQPLKLRRECLETVLDGAPAVLLPVRRLADHGPKAWLEVLERGYEGLVAKDQASPYVVGRTLKWLKVKQAKYRAGERGWEGKP